MEGGSLALDATTTSALQKLLDDPATTAAALPIVAKWDKTGALKASANRQAGLLLAQLGAPTTSEDRASSSPRACSQFRSAGRQRLPRSRRCSLKPPLPTRLVTTLGDAAGPDVDAALIAALARTNSTPIFDQILRRPEATLALLAAMKDGKVTPAGLGPGNVARLRSHPNRQVAQQANALLNTLSPAGKAKSEVIAALTPEIEKPGDAEKGKALFTGACANCHKLGALGKTEVGPPLNGMGAHGRAALLVHVIDPNREVDPSFWQWNVTTKSGETLSGVIAGENAASITLRNHER